MRCAVEEKIRALNVLKTQIADNIGDTTKGRKALKVLEREITLFKLVGDKGKKSTPKPVVNNVVEQQYVQTVPDKAAKNSGLEKSKEPMGALHADSRTLMQDVKGNKAILSKETLDMISKEKCK